MTIPEMLVSCGRPTDAEAGEQGPSMAKHARRTGRSTPTLVMPAWCSGGTRPQEIVREMAAEGVVLAVRFAESVTCSHQFLHARLQPENHLTFIPSLSRLQEPGYGFPKGVEDPSFWKLRLHFLCLLSYYYLGRLLLTRTLAFNPRPASSTTNTIRIRCRFSEG